MSIRILLVDDHAVLREGLHALLSDEPDLEILDEASNGEEALILVDQLHPDVVLMDISMPGLDGIKTAQVLINNHPHIRIIILTVHEDLSFLKTAIQAGVSGYIPKRATRAEIVNAIHVVQRGDVYIHTKLTRTLLKEVSQRHMSNETSLEALSPREIEVLRYIVRGYTNRQTAEALGLSVRTIEGHRASLLKKLGLRSRLELVNFAEQHGILEFAEFGPRSSQPEIS